MTKQLFAIFAALTISGAAHAQSISYSRGGGSATVVCQSGTAVSSTAETETNLASCILPPLGPHDRVTIQHDWEWVNSANVKVTRIRLHTAAGVDGTIMHSSGNATTTAGARCTSRLWNVGATNSQVRSGSTCQDIIGTAAAKATAAIETGGGTAALNFTAAGNAAAEEVTLLGYSVIVHRVP